MTKTFTALHKLERRIFMRINRHFERKLINWYFRSITHLGGTTATISAVLILLLFTKESLHKASIASAFSLAINQIPVQFLKKIYPRKRPYLSIAGTLYPANPLKDHSFPSGHTTAVFSVITPLILFYPILSIILVPIGLSVGLSRIYLGLHYPSDVLVGIGFGVLTSLISYFYLVPYFF
ncbi:phosphatase PAP2 family protein [Terrilactibacillus sp. BCM23-1]|uniref:Phosphatase PAP2 family protein n=1 Tax=Terrilactibacillus tamarindi TaxID=2599694 RepID=A0A6N8CT26_9BACI|nr:phosphatase PAP2 family protein [Terrilactibacillus tamarindi]MTT33211.1 phosphatase PAP2 family protein [Terrilactibacillus tamarindi]